MNYPSLPGQAYAPEKQAYAVVIMPDEFHSFHYSRDRQVLSSESDKATGVS
ncbi:hypothetical protein [Salmonella enterica]|uniref:hypothetical protein n=1 Tax=Salmonella enterica TaxID=28901 RepID=UPI0037331FA5